MSNFDEELVKLYSVQAQIKKTLTSRALQKFAVYGGRPHF